MTCRNSLISTLTVIFAIALVTEGNWYGKRDDDDTDNIFLRYLEQKNVPHQQSSDNEIRMMLLKKLVGKIKTLQSSAELEETKRTTV